MSGPYPSAQVSDDDRQQEEQAWAERRQKVTWLRMYWENYYEISCEEGGIFQAIPKFDRSLDILTADTASDLLIRMKDHHSRYLGQ